MIDSARRRRNPYARNALLPAILCALFLLWLLYSYDRRRSHLEEVLRSTATSVASTVDVSIAFMGQRRRERRELLGEYLRELLASSRVAGIALLRSGRIVIQVGEGISSQGLPGDLAEAWNDDYLLVGQRLRSPVVCDFGPGALNQPEEVRHRPGDVQGGRPPDEAGIRDGSDSLIVVAVAILPIRHELAAARRQCYAFAAVGLLCCLAFFFLRVSSTKAVDLRTKLLLAEERLNHMRDRAEAAAGLAHETKNPLGVIRGLAQVCGDESDTEDLREYAARVIEEVDRTVSRINEFLHYSRPREPRIRVVALGAIFEELREITMVGGEGGFTCTVDAAGVSVKADPELLRQALFNLLVNAVAAVKRVNGEETTRAVAMIATPVQESRCEIRVRDNGCGIEAEDLPRLFVPYFSTWENGTGLGLAVVKDIVEAHGWTISVHSTVGTGTEFVVTNIELG